MNIFLNIFFSILLIISLNFFFLKKNFLVDKKKLSHKSLVSKDLVPLTGGFAIISTLFILNNNYLIFFFLIFFMGVLSDLFILRNPVKKLFIQSFVILTFIYFSGIRVLDTKINFLDYLLQYEMFGFLFITICLLVLMNGSNFMDGINTFVCGYFILVLLCVLYIGEKHKLLYNFNDYYYLFTTLIVIFFFNSFSKIYLGDSGSFLLSFVVGYYLIELFNNNLHLLKSISSIFVILLLWYPAFENFFSIIRKLIEKKGPTSPDNLHLHQLLFLFLKRRIKLKVNFLNTLTGCIINVYNLFILTLGSQFYYHTKYLISLICFNILVYVAAYVYFRAKLV